MEIIKGLCIKADVMNSRVNGKEKELERITKLLNEKFRS